MKQEEVSIGKYTEGGQKPMMIRFRAQTTAK